MANKLGSGSRGPPQGMLPVLLLLVASIQAGLVVASVPLTDVVEAGAHLLGGGVEKLVVAGLSKNPRSKDFANGLKAGFKAFKIQRKVIGRQNPGPGGGPATYFVVDTAVVTPPGGGPRASFRVSTADITARSAVRTGVCAVGAVGRQSYINLLLGDSNQGAAVSLGRPFPATLEECPAAASEGAWAVLGLGWGGDLSTRFPTFSYLVTSYGNTVVWLPTTASQQQQQQQPYGRAQAATTPLMMLGLNDARYFVEITGIRVGRLLLVLTRTEFGARPYATGGEQAYLSTTQPYTYLQRDTYDRLKATLMLEFQRLNPRATPRGGAGADDLCYVGVATELMVPRMEIIFANNSAMEVGVSNVWYQEEGSSSTICLAIRPTTSPEEVSNLGSMLQIGRMMTVNLRARTLTF